MHGSATSRWSPSGIRLARDGPASSSLDAGNGAGGPLGHRRACRSSGLSPEALFCEMDGRFPNHHPDPTVPKNLEALIERVTKTGARVGLAYDGDADRLGAVDANGEIVWGDQLMILFSRALLAEHPGAAILGEVKCSQTLYDDIAKHGGRPIMWKTGHSLIKTKMKEERRAARRRDERAPLLRRPLLRLRRRHLRVAAPARDPRERPAQRSARCSPTCRGRSRRRRSASTAPTRIKFDVVAAVRDALPRRGPPGRRHRRRAHLLRHRERPRVGPGPRVEHRARSWSCASRRRARSGATRIRAEVERRRRASARARLGAALTSRAAAGVATLDHRVGAPLGDGRLPRARHRQPAPRRRAPARPRARR